MVACYTFPVTTEGLPLISPPGQESAEKDQPLPSMDLHGGGDLSSGSQDPARPSMDLHGGHGYGSSQADRPLPSMDYTEGEITGLVIQFQMMEFSMMKW